MSVVITGKYLGEKRIVMTHGPSGAEVSTDAPIDNAGKGEAFSPTDLVSGALGACMLTVMGIVAEKHQIDISGATYRVEKIMYEGPRRIGALPLTFHLPAKLKDADRRRLEAAAKSCPVHHSLHPDIGMGADFVYDV